MAHDHAGFTNCRAEWHRNQFEMGKQACSLCSRQGIQQVILAGVMNFRQVAHPRVLRHPNPQTGGLYYLSSSAPHCHPPRARVQ